MKLKVTQGFRKAFIWTCILGILFNLVFDLFSIRQLRLAKRANARVSQTYEGLVRLQKLDRALEVLLIPPVSQAEYERVYSELEHVKKMALVPRQQELLQKFSQQLQFTEGSMAATGTIAEILSIESQELKERLQSDTLNSRATEHSLIWGLILDGFLFVLLFVIFIADARSRKKIEQNLSESLNNLRTSHLVLQEEQQKRQMSLKTTVHDLKNPLGTIRGFAELIGEEFGSSPTAQEFSETIKRISQNSLELVDSLLHTNDTTAVKMAPTDLVSLLDEVCSQAEIQALSKKQIMTKDFSIDEAPILGNRMKLDELLANLINNSIKYSPPSSRIWVRCSRIKDKYKVEVEDEGPGFTADDKKKAFQYGQKLSAKPTGNESSTGYGLFIAKQIVDLHKGQIKINETSTGRGARISFELPSL